MRYTKWRLIRTQRLSSPSSRLLSLSLQRFPCVTPGEEIFRLPTSKSCLPMFYLCSLPLLNQYLSPSCFILPSLCHDLSNVYLIFQLPFRVPFFPPYLLPVIPTGSNTSKACLHPSREPFTQTGSVPRPGALRGGQIRSCMENTSRGKNPLSYVMECMGRSWLNIHAALLQARVTTFYFLSFHLHNYF